MLRAIREIQPTWVVGENVRGLVNWNGGMVFDEVQADLEAEGYEVIPFILPACGVNAPHRRDRVWFIAYSDNTRRSAGFRQVSGADEEVSQRNEDTQFSNAGNGTIAHRTSREQRQKVRGRNEQTAQHGTSKHGYSGTTTNTENTGQQTCAIGQRQKQLRGRNEPMGPRQWDRFPTQSPVLSRNDGFQTESLRQRIREDSMGYLSEKEIDKIVSKAINEWREESIKSAGNAVVPQVVLQIFKAIQAVNNTL